MKKINLRSSSLGGFADCMARGFASAFRKNIIALGYELNERNYNVAAALGSGVHEGVKLDLTAIKDGLDRPRIEDVEECAIDCFNEKVQSETQYDNVTPNYSTAQKQISSIMKSHYLKVAPQSDPEFVEERLWCNVGEKVILTGQPDEISRSRVIKDIKTGAKKSHIYQFGAYGILAEAHGIEIQGAEVIGLPRPKRNGVVEIYSEKISGDILHHGAIPSTFRIIEKINDGVDELVAGNQILEVNPSSSMCSRRMCAAWGNAFCVATCGK